LQKIQKTYNQVITELQKYMKQKLLNLYFRFFGILAKIYIKKQKPFII